MREKACERKSQEKSGRSLGGATRNQKSTATFSNIHPSRPTPTLQPVQRSLFRQLNARLQENHHTTHHHHQKKGHAARGSEYERFPAYENHQVRRNHLASKSLPHVMAGHRGFAHLPWKWVPREPPAKDGNESFTTLFVDGLHFGMAKEWLLDKFSECGRVKDVFISSKVRKNCGDAFGFVRYGKKRKRLWMPLIG
ncbi:unnamed protein product [Amaranthus hypochondriacus]